MSKDGMLINEFRLSKNQSKTRRNYQLRHLQSSKYQIVKSGRNLNFRYD